VARAVETSRPLIDVRRHKLTLALPPRPLKIEGDPTRLTQVVGNLVNNAAKYTEEGGDIHLSLERSVRDDGVVEAVIRVKDSGVGIPPEMLGKVFDLFIQVERTIDRAQGGLGIGLALVRRLVEMHNGTVEAHSDGTDCGSEFVVRLPVIPETEASLVEAATASSAAASSSGRRVLVVDDNRDSARTMTLLLRKMGNDVATAYDGAEAVEAAAKFQPDVVLLDIGLPTLDGYEAARLIREHSSGKPLSLVALTGWGQDEDRRRSQDAGFDHHVVKPVDRRTLLQLFDRIASAAGARSVRADPGDHR
jgi:CheY-like chemotaxis protein